MLPFLNLLAMANRRSRSCSGLFVLRSSRTDQRLERKSTRGAKPCKTLVVMKSRASPAVGAVGAVGAVALCATRVLELVRRYFMRA